MMVKAQHSQPPRTNLSGSAHFYHEKNIPRLYITCYFNDEVNCTVPFPSVSVP
jgi:hypothetical protein